ncbi:DUF4245 domain-containing protein [Dactylosporangium sp. AC04546]|uniref:DUF4245 domain-containing protein n=1 Tax=Dactylosporangium sp. AC04546 TaxID=2862460 RepID=UPI001EDF62AE|nr:DUF4245 domain-containing protein [Dactylosporangium sp. AC04546]WVK84790.1 DUF4245 domain-containing protein [Dactylosporangium sp. AC04546]
METETETAAAPQPRAGRRPRDMALSMIVLLVPVFLLVVFYRFLGNESPPAVDTTEVYGSVQRAGQFELLKPEGLPSDWRIASATYTDGVLRLGITAPDDGAMQLVESAKPTDVLVADVVAKGAKPADTVMINGMEWRRYSDARPGERALVQVSGDRTVVVVGRASDAQLTQLAGSLKA